MRGADIVVVNVFQSDDLEARSKAIRGVLIKHLVKEALGDSYYRNDFVKNIDQPRDNSLDAMTKSAEYDIIYPVSG